MKAFQKEKMKLWEYEQNNARSYLESSNCKFQAFDLVSLRLFYLCFFFLKPILFYESSSQSIINERFLDQVLRAYGMVDSFLESLPLFQYIFFFEQLRTLVKMVCPMVISEQESLGIKKHIFYFKVKLNFYLLKDKI